MHLADFPRLKAATPQRKLDLIDELWESIPPDAVATPASHVNELERRLDALQHDPNKALLPDEARCSSPTTSATEAVIGDQRQIQQSAHSASPG